METQKKISELRDAASHFRQRADAMEQEAFRKQQALTERAMRKRDDRLINRTQAIELLWFTTHQALKNWERKVEDLEYLDFQNNKILRSEVLRFRDDYQDGTIHSKLRTQ